MLPPAHFMRAGPGIGVDETTPGILCGEPLPRRERAMSASLQTAEKCCPICGRAASEPTYSRFGKFCCCEAHAEEYVKEVRAQKVQALAGSRPAEPFARQVSGCCGGPNGSI